MAPSTCNLSTYMKKRIRARNMSNTPRRFKGLYRPVQVVPLFPSLSPNRRSRERITLAGYYVLHSLKSIRMMDGQQLMGVFQTRQLDSIEDVLDSWVRLMWCLLFEQFSQRKHEGKMKCVCNSCCRLSSPRVSAALRIRSSFDERTTWAYMLIPIHTTSGGPDHFIDMPNFEFSRILNHRRSRGGRRLVSYGSRTSFLFDIELLMRCASISMQQGLTGVNQMSDIS